MDNDTWMILHRSVAQDLDRCRGARLGGLGLGLDSPDRRTKNRINDLGKLTYILGQLFLDRSVTLRSRNIRIGPN